MINYHYETDFSLGKEESYTDWVERIIVSEGKSLGELNYIFCDDAYLHEINMQYLNHDTLTDIISFDYTEGVIISGDIFVSVERVTENAQEFGITFAEELTRVMAHGVLHYCGFRDKTEKDAALMRQKEEEKIAMFHVEHSK